jgi:hypothetical protein
MPALALARTGPDPVSAARICPRRRGSDWNRFRTRFPHEGRIHPLVCLVAIAVCAFTASGNDRFAAVGQWIKRANRDDLGPGACEQPAT